MNTGRGYDQLVCWISMKAPGQLSRFYDYPGRQFEQKDPWIPECLLNPFFNRGRKVETPAFHELCYFPAGDDADTKTARLVLLDEIQRRAAQTAVSMDPPDPDVGIQEDH